jgi:uncharacterized protein (DUF1919 family)
MSNTWLIQTKIVHPNNFVCMRFKDNCIYKIRSLDELPFSNTITVETSLSQTRDRNLCRKSGF